MIGKIRQWLARSAIRIRQNGLDGAERSLYLLKRGLWRAGQYAPIGTNVFDREWDVLVILDGCRVDLMREVSEDYTFIDDVESIWSVGSTSAEWIRETFDSSELSESNIAYVTANPFVDDYQSLLEGVFIDNVWKYGFDEELGTVPPRVVTDRAISVYRDRSIDRLIVHYMQPHHPFIGRTQSVATETSIEDIVGKRTDGDDGWEPGSLHANNVWYQLKSGKVDSDTVWESYRSNLELVLDEIKLLLQNMQGDVVISSDHGNAVGELGMYGHPMGFLHPSVRTVPWINHYAHGKEHYSPPDYQQNLDENNTKIEQLKSLGYR